MRLPEYLKKISPVGETLTAVETGNNVFTAAVAEKNAQLFVGTATYGLSFWESDYGLKDRSGGTVDKRRLDIRIAMAGGRTLSPAYLEELAVTLGGADAGEVTENFSEQEITLAAVAKNRLPENTAALERALDRLKPAHLSVAVVPVSAFTGAHTKSCILHGAVLLEI